MKRISCVSIDLINADKPPAALAFLAGACELTNKTYHCVSVNSKLIKDLSTDEYNRIYSKIKTNQIEQSKHLLTPTLNEIIQEIVEFKPDAVLVSVFSYMQHDLAQMFLQHLRQHVNVDIVAGGPGVQTEINGQTFGQRLLNQQLITHYCLGEGDEVLVAYLRGEKNILGLNEANYPESWVPQIDDLDRAFVMPSYQLINTDHYHNLENKNSAVYSLSTSRGCVRNCSFCTVGKSWPKFRFRSGHHVAQEVLKHHREIGALHFTIVDSLINGSLKSFSDFNNEIIKLKEQYSSLEKFSYNGMFIVRDKKTHNEDLFRRMKQAGCDSLAIGVETGSDRLRFEMNKKFTNADLDHHLEMCQKYGIRNAFLTFVGYPTETDEDFEMTLQMLDRYQKYLVDDTIIGINHSGVFSLSPGSPIFDDHETMGIIISERDLKIDWINQNNPDLTVKKRILRDLEFRQHAAKLRYPIPYATRYLEYLKELDHDFVPLTD